MRVLRMAIERRISEWRYLTRGCSGRRCSDRFDWRQYRGFPLGIETPQSIENFGLAVREIFLLLWITVQVEQQLAGLGA